MRKILKILGWLVAGLVALIVAAVVAITVFFDPNDYKDEIAAYVERETGRTLAIKGDISLSFFPWIGVEIGATELGNAPGFGDQPFARVARVKVSAKVLPLLRGRLVTDDPITLEGLELHLVRNAKGRSNWDDLLAGAGEPEPSPAASEGEGRLDFDIQGVRVRAGRFVLDDRSAGRYLALEDVDLTTSRLQLGKPVDVELELGVRRGEHGEAQPLRLAGLVTAVPEQGTVALEKLELAFGGMEATGALRGRDLNKAPKFQGSLQVAQFKPKRLFQALAMEPPQTADPKALRSAALTTSLQANTASVRLTDMKLQVDETTVQGDLALADVSSGAVTFDLNIDTLDLDRYLPPASEEKEKTSDEVKAGAPALPVEMLRALNVRGTLRIASLKAFNIKSRDVELTTTARQGKLRFHPARAQLYEGAYSGDVRLDVQQTPPVLRMNETLTNVQLNPMLRDVAGWDWLSGKGEVRTSLSAKGVDIGAMRKTLQGNVNLAVSNGTIKGVNLAHRVRQAEALLRNQPQPPDAPEETDFAALTASASIQGGVVNNRDLKMQSPLLRVEGSGTADLGREHLDYGVKVLFTKTLEGQGGRRLDDLTGVPIPVRISGPFAKPKVGVDLAQALADSQKQRLEKKKRELEERARDKVDDKLKDLLRR